MIRDPYSHEQLRALRQLSHTEVFEDDAKADVWLRYSDRADSFIGWTAGIVCLLLLAQLALAFIGW